MLLSFDMGGRVGGLVRQGGSRDVQILWFRAFYIHKFAHSNL